MALGALEAAAAAAAADLEDVFSRILLPGLLLPPAEPLLALSLPLLRPPSLPPPLAPPEPPDTAGTMAIIVGVMRACVCVCGVGERRMEGERVV